jgi:uncharacterized membrane protein
MLIIEFVNLFFSGILAGVEFAIHYGFQSSTQALDEKPQIQLRQGVIRRLRVIVPAIFACTVLSGIAVVFLQSNTAGLFFRYGALFAIFIWIIVRIIGTVRINKATLDWKPEAPPKNWKELISKSERFHVVGTWAALLAFAFFLIAMAIQLPEN